MPIGQQFSHFQQQTPQACVVDLVPPTGGAISSLTNNPDGSVKAQWPAASDANAPITYEVYVQKGTATGLFSTTPFLARGLSLDIYRDSLGAMIVQGETIHAAVRAVDALGNQNTNTTTLSVVAAGLGYANLLSIIPGAVWDRPRTSHVTVGTFGEGVNLTAAERTAISVAVEAALLNDGDGQALIAAIVASIGNQNIDQVLLIAAIRADLERVGGLIASRASQSSVNALELETDALSRVNALLAAIAAIPNAPSASVIADAVWDEATSGHTTGGTFGLNAQTPAINAQQVADAVWDAPIVDHNDAGTFGANAQTPAVNPGQVADAVWDALTADHTDVGSFGANAQNPPVNAGQIADAVWDETLGDHLTVGSTGKKLYDGLTAQNFIPAGQQVEVDIAETGIEVEVNPKQEINIEIGDC